MVENGIMFIWYCQSCDAFKFCERLSYDDTYERALIQVDVHN